MRGFTSPVLGFLILTLTACGGGDEGTSIVDSDVASVVISPSSLFFDALGATQTLSATVRDGGGQEIQRTVQWSSSDDAVASVSAAGVVLALSRGSAAVSATVAGISGLAVVAVDPMAATLEIISGDLQAGLIGTALGTALVIRVLDSRGNLMSGETVTYSITAGAGTLSDTTVTSDAAGETTTLWTLGTISGTQSVEATSRNASATFTASASPGPPVGIEPAAGNDQRGGIDSELANPIVAKVVDSFGNGIAGESIDWATSNGSLGAASGVTDSDGNSSVRWTLGPVEGPQMATAAWQTTNVATFTALAGIPPTISGISPDTLIEGGVAVVTGTNFGAVIVDNEVLIGGQPASITSVTPTQITFTVPSFSCIPARDVAVGVSSLGFPAGIVDHPLQAPDIIDLAVGEQLVMQGLPSYCLQLAAGSGTDEYLIGVQSVSPRSGPPTAVSVTGSLAPGAQPAAALPIGDAGSFGSSFIDEGSLPGLNSTDLLAQERRGQTHMELLERLLEPLRTAPAGATALLAAGEGAQPVVVPATVSVGDRIILRVRSLTGGSGGCGPLDFSAVTAELKVKGQHGLWFEDIANPPGGLTVADYQTLSSQFDASIHTTHEEHFGQITDVDGNSHTVILVTKEINIDNAVLEGSVLGFQNPCDFVPRSTFAASNEGEFFYSLAPDPTGIHGDLVATADVREFLPFVVAHELTHIIQVGRRTVQSRNLMDSFMMEGQATYGEEVAGNAINGGMPGQDYGADVALQPDPTGVRWYSNGFIDLAFFYGWDGENPGGRVVGAPEECTWTLGITDPCLSRPSWYGVTWSFLRWASDQFGPQFGGEQGFHKALIDNDLSGFENFQDILGPLGDFREMLAQWSAALYVDGRIVPADPRLTLSSWNMFDIEQNLRQALRLQPRARSFAPFADQLNVRGPSLGYFLVGGTAHPSMVVQVDGGSGSSLPGEMQTWIVRIR